MLLQFNFKNYKSFRDDTTLDLTAARISEHDHLFEIGNEKVLPVAVIFGANASGKSNVLSAFNYMSLFVMGSLYYEGRKKKKGEMGFPYSSPFLFDEKSKDSESSFEVYFIDSKNENGKFYNYGFTVDRNGVVEEWLNSKAKSSRGDFKRVFYRSRSEMDLAGIPNKSQENIRIALGKETLIVSLGHALQVSELKLIYNWFYNNEVVDFGDPDENLVLSSQFPSGFEDNVNVRMDVVKYFSSFDSSIIGFEVKDLGTDDDSSTANYQIDAVHKMIGSDKTVAIPLKLESAGTQKMFALYSRLQDILEDGSVLFVDELNARLHPLLVRAFVQTFLNPEVNKNKAQLIFTTHDSWQLNSNILRRDEIWFTEKSEDGVSALYSLVDFVDEDGAKIRKDENYEKNYLLGKYGAIPSLKSFDIFTEE